MRQVPVATGLCILLLLFVIIFLHSKNSKSKNSKLAQH